MYHTVFLVRTITVPLLDGNGACNQEVTSLLPLWSATFPNSSVLSNTFSIGASCLENRVRFSVAKTPAFYGLRIEELNRGRTLMLRAKLPCTIDVFTSDDGHAAETGSFVVSVSAAELLAVLAVLGMSQSVTVSQRHGSSDLSVFMTGIVVVHSIPAQAPLDTPYMSLKPLIYMYEVKVAVDAARLAIRVDSQNVEKVTLSVLKLGSQFTLVVQGSGEHVFSFSSTDNELWNTQGKGSAKAAAAVAATAVEHVYRGTFPAHLLEKVLQSLADDADVSLFVTNHLPLCMRVSMDNDESFAVITVDETEE
jgi:hypothetical protein